MPTVTATPKSSRWRFGAHEEVVRSNDQVVRSNGQVVRIVAGGAIDCSSNILGHLRELHGWLQELRHRGGGGQCCSTFRKISKFLIASFRCSRGLRQKGGRQIALHCT